MSVVDTLAIKCIYSNPYYPQDNGRIENVHNSLKCTIANFIYGNILEWDDAFSLPTMSHHQCMTWSHPTISYMVVIH